MSEYRTSLLALDRSFLKPCYTVQHNMQTRPCATSCPISWGKTTGIQGAEKAPVPLSAGRAIVSGRTSINTPYDRRGAYFIFWQCLGCQKYGYIWTEQKYLHCFWKLDFAPDPHRGCSWTSLVTPPNFLFLHPSSLNPKFAPPPKTGFIFEQATDGAETAAIDGLVLS